MSSLLRVKVVFFTFFGFLSLLPFTIYAQDTPEAISCFDYYHFGSVQVDVAPTLEQTLPGTPLRFAGTIRNANEYPIVDGQVWVKIFKIDEASEALTKQNGYPLVDFLLVKDDLIIGANTERAIDFEYLVPSNMAGGEYEAAFYFTSAQRFNLLGLSFTDDVTGNKAPFRIVSAVSPVVLNKNTVLLNTTLFRFAAPPPHFTKDESVTAHVELVNPSTEQRIVEVTWITSKWDGILESNEVKRETSAIVLAPNETKLLSYTPPLIETSVTFVQAILKDADAKSMLHIRFVRDGYEDIRINFPSITKYPLRAGAENTLFSCVHSTNEPLVSDNTLILTLNDSAGNVVHTYTYTGDVTGDMMGLKSTFTPDTDLTTFSLTATLAHKGVVVDEVTQTYDCTILDPEHCLKEAVHAAVDTDTTSRTMYIIVLSMMILTLFSSVAVYQRRKKNTLSDSQITPQN